MARDQATRHTTGAADLQRIEHGWDVYGADGEKVGDVAEVRGDDLIVSKGWLFPTERSIPAAAIAGVEHDRVTLRVMADQLDAQDWDRLPDDIDTAHQERAGGRAAMGTATDEDEETIQLREEELTAHKRTVEAGEVEIRKEVVSEQQTLEVPVTREEVTIERRPIDRAEGERLAGEIGDGETIRVPVREEQVTVEKDTVLTEEIEVGKRAVSETRRVSDTVRREEVRVDHDDEVDIRHRQADVPHEGEHRRRP